MYNKPIITEVKMNGITAREKLVTDMNEIVKILDNSKVVHIGMIDGDEPYVVPMNYGYTLIDGELTLYLHGARSGRKLDVLRANPKVFIEIDTDLVSFEGEVACKYGMSYSSIMGEGIAEIVEDAEGKKQALSILMKTQTGKDFEFDDKLVSVVTAIVIRVGDFTAKKRPLPSGR